MCVWYWILVCAPFAQAADGLPAWHRAVDEAVARAEALTIAPPPSAAATEAAPSASINPRLTALRPMIESVFRQEGIPEKMLWLGMVESGYNPWARSPKNALGIWQLMPDTARRFGLQVGAIDERTHPLKSTQAAARYLRFLYDYFDDWKLALAAYNAGEGRVQSAIRKAGTRDFSRLVDLRLLPAETRAYVPAVLAAQAADSVPKRAPTVFAIAVIR